ncbi:uncharacterized protein EV420DRAFT_883550 [Desarmillaria tabescens]|uniref:Uncharacterized protein n=1 Tax=Armillaria tabescens TaxID=1929756 RepID=A0AA39JQM9_ARMTA|nr:uncharacterized protein EV420DRAFT_883550 [Desarmillaria tabescens]KAK0446969.1 hypothetical protein EV420DRAFT_883550 [Desarmillaria tabescens]
MIARTYLGTTADLTDTETKDISVGLDAQFNEVMITALTHGIYTGVVAVTLWTIASRNNNCNYGRPRPFVFVILLLYLLATFNLYCQWAQNFSCFPTTEESFSQEYMYNRTQDTPILLTMGIDAILSTVLADATLA